MIARSQAFALMLLISYTAHINCATAQNVVTYNDEINRSLARIAAGDGMAVDPTLRGRILADVAVFTTNFCYPAGSEDAIRTCASTVQSVQTIDSVLRSYLKEIRDFQPTDLESIASRLATSVGRSIIATGWGGTIKSDVGVVKFPENTRSLSLMLETEVGDVPIDKGANILLAVPGPIAVLGITADGRQLQLRGQLSARRILELIPDEIEARPIAKLHEADTDRFCDRTMEFPLTGLAVPFNSSNGARATIYEPEETRQANLAPVIRKSALDIKIVDPSNLCNEACRRGLGQALAEAVSAWRAGCSRCDSNALSVIRVGGVVQIDSRLAIRARRVADKRLDASALNLLDHEHLADEAPLSRSAAFALPTPGTSPFSILDDRVRNDICSLPTAAAPWIPAARSFLCDGGDEHSDEVLRSQLILKSGATACGTSTSFIACGQPNGDIELAFVGGELSIPGAGIVGHKVLENAIPADAREVLLHEVGHWFGVPHHWLANPEAPDELLEERSDIEMQRPDVMSDTLGDGEPCLSPQSLAILNNAVDTRWPHRISSRSGLRRPRIPRSEND